MTQAQIAPTVHTRFTRCLSSTSVVSSLASIGYGRRAATTVHLFNTTTPDTGDLKCSVCQCVVSGFLDYGEDMSLWSTDSKKVPFGLVIFL